MIKNEKGFTLIELLVVIAIIGILSGVVLTNVRSANDGALDKSILANMKSIQSNALLLYGSDTYNNKYNTTAAFTTVAAASNCATAPVLDTIFADPVVALALNKIVKASGGQALNCTINSTGYAIVSPLKVLGPANAIQYACIDSRGVLKTGYGSSSTPYTAATGTATAALTATTSLECN